jgi:hypothetical protein
MDERHARRQFLRQGGVAVAVAGAPALLSAAARRSRSRSATHDPHGRFTFAQGVTG